MTALMGGDGTMEQQTEKDFRFENDPQAEVFLLSEKTKEKAPSIAASCFFVVRLAHSYPDGAPLVAITGQVGTDRLHIPVVNTMMAKGIIPMDDKYSLWTIGIPQKDYVNQLFDRPDPYSVLFYLFFVVFIFE